ncbi:PorP/SprF family type IX secretion system membrane protein [Ohtaekwangia sp.]|uniref:PorP/SprF family type IX secretion system membrane protein n=1 Tax=Ohtaekwangia sp. TaxID=2066019 RepID=UPI002F93C67B
MKNIKLLFVLMMMLPYTPSFAQQDPLYSLYLSNPIAINPAYSGLYHNLEVNVDYRDQWAGFDGQPKTATANASMSLRNNTMGTGLVVVQDKIGENTNTSINAAYAYQIKLNAGEVFSFGMQAGFTNFKSDPSQVKIYNADDPAFAAYSQMKVNIGAGAILKGDRYLVGLSVPRLLPSTLDAGNEKLQVYQQHYYLQGYYLIHLNDKVVFRPAVLFKDVKHAPLSTDFSASVILDRKFTAGIFTRNLKSYGIVTQLNFLEHFKLAYAFEMPTSSSVGTRYTTHEITLGIRAAVFRFHDNIAW